MVNSDPEEMKLSPELEAQIDEALRNARDPYDDEVALEAKYEATNDLLILQLKNGRRVAIPREDLQGLESGSVEDLSAVELVGLGTGLHWEKLNADFSVKGLADGLYGTPRWMAALEQRRRERLKRAS